MKARLLAVDPTLQVTIVDSALVRVRRGDLSFELGLDNLQLSCRGGTEACDAAIEAAVQNVRDGLRGEAFEQAAKPEQVMLTVKPTEWVTEMNARIRLQVPDKSQQNQLISEPLAGDLSMVLALDLPNGIRMLSAQDVGDLHVEPKAAWELAKKNLGAARPTVKLTRIEGTPIFTNAEDDDYISALMALPELWTPLAGQVKGDLLVSFPSRNRVFAAGSASATEVKGLKTVTEKALAEEHHPLSGSIYRWSRSGWSVHTL